MFLFRVIFSLACTVYKREGLRYQLAWISPDMRPPDIGKKSGRKKPWAGVSSRLESGIIFLVAFYPTMGLFYNGKYGETLTYR